MPEKKTSSTKTQKAAPRRSNAGRKPIYSEALVRITGRVALHHLHYLEERAAIEGISGSLRTALDKAMKYDTENKPA